MLCGLTHRDYAVAYYLLIDKGQILLLVLETFFD